jgi:predicted TIM-barrel fold metal-dependent hydrolase
MKLDAPTHGGVIDVSAWVGQYPFRGVPSSMAELKRRAASCGIARFVVAPYEAVFWENTLDAYAEWAEKLADEPLVEVWPVVRPGAMHGLDKLLERHRPRGLRLVSNYHGFRLYESTVDPIMRLARERGMVVQVFQRLADERWQWIAHVPEVPLHDLEYVTSVYDRQPIIVSAMNRPQSLADRLTHQPQVYVDISRVRGPAFAIESLVSSVPVNRLLFGSLWPVQIIEATLWQVTTARIDAAQRDAILHDNARSLLSAPGCE